MSLVVEAIVKRFRPDAPPLLDGVSFTIAPGSISCLLGPSGVGKSTLLHIIAGLDDADAGTVRVEGRRLDGVPAHRRPLTLLMQQPQLFAHLDVIENVAFGLRVRGIGRRERRQRAHELLELVGISELAQRSTHHLSGGEQQRVALARALAVRPAVLLADEPFASLDASVRRELQTLVTSVHRELGTTMLLVTHDLDEAARVGDHWVVLEHGRVAASGSPHAVMHQPQSTPLGQLAILGHRVEPGVDERADRTSGASAARSSEPSRGHDPPPSGETATTARPSP